MYLPTGFRLAWGALLLVAVTASTAAAQELAGSFDQLRVLVKPGDTIRVTDGAGQEARGTIAALTSTSLELLVAGEWSEMGVWHRRRVGVARRSGPRIRVRGCRRGSAPCGPFLWWSWRRHRGRYRRDDFERSSDLLQDHDHVSPSDALVCPHSGSTRHPRVARVLNRPVHVAKTLHHFLVSLRVEPERRSAFCLRFPSNPRLPDGGPPG